MSVELVTGYSGVGRDGEPNRHVSSADDGARQAGTVGLGCYVLSTGSKLSATMEDANTLVVADGDAMMYGRHVRMPDATSFTIPTGVQGQKVSNLAVIRYEVGADSVESVTPVVLTGEPSAGEPADPEYEDGSILEGATVADMPLYRVVTDGVNAEDPVPLFDLLAPMADLRDSISLVVTHQDVNVLTGQVIAAGSSASTSASVSVPPGKQMAGVFARETWDWAIAQVTATGYGSTVYVTVHNPSDQAIHADTMVRAIFVPVA